MIGSKGDLKQGILGALTAGFMHPMKAGIAYGVTGGVRSRLSGGSFKSGFLGLAVSYGASWSGAYEAAGVSSQANTWAQRAQNVIASYVVGGVAAELGGGKFANGGMSAAFSRMFNDLSDYNKQLSTFENYIMGNANDADMNAAYGKQFERVAKNTLTASAEFSATIAFAFVGGVAISGAKLVLPTLRSVYYGYAHHMQKVLDFIEGVAIPGVPPASGAGTAGYVFSREVYDPVEHSK